MASRTLRSLVIATVALALAATIAVAGKGKACCKKGDYRADQEITILGTVAEVIPHECHMSGMGIHLAVTTENEVTVVRLGPSTYFEDQGVDFVEGDLVEITGVMSSGCDDSEGLLARIVKLNGVVLTLRDPDGVPAWSGEGRGKGLR